MAGESDLQEKTEEATPQRREDFRKQGQVAQTRELSSSLALFGLSLVLYFLGKTFVEQFFTIYHDLYGSQLLGVVQSGNVLPAFVYSLQKILMLSVPVFVVMFIFGIASSVVQIGFLFTSETLTPNLKKVNPIEGLKRLFSLKALVEGIKAIFKFSLVGLVIYLVLQSEFSVIPKLIYADTRQIFFYVGGLFFKTMVSIGALMGILAGLDYLFQRFDMEKQMRMTKQEVKEEVKSREGDPLIKARIRKIQKEMATRRMMNDVPTADVVITNPTHLAIALKYQPEKYAAPIILAKGADHVAQKIRELAASHEIPIVENKPLARTIYKTLEVGQVIPRELFEAVAEVLAYVFRLKRKKKLNG
jgi:flagellar biosynthetic protein FlhB